MRSPEPGLRLAGLTTLGVGGPARWYARAESVHEVREADAWAREQGMPLTVLGGGSNVLIADEGFAGLVMRVCSLGISHSSDGADVLVKAAAGESWDDVVAWAVAHELAGIECLSGIPGTVGGTPIQNVGAYGQEVSRAIESVVVFDRTTRTTMPLAPEACEFGYRTSRFKTRDVGRFVICEVTFRLRRGVPTISYPDLIRYFGERGMRMPTLADVRNAVLTVRRSKGMVIDVTDVDTRSVGSFFTNPVVAEDAVDEIERQVHQRPPAYAAGPGLMKVPAAWLLEHAGFRRGYGKGSVGLSSKHPLAIINRGGASARAIVGFAAAIKRSVADKFGVSLVPEAAFIGFGGDDEVRYLIERTA